MNLKKANKFSSFIHDSLCFLIIDLLQTTDTHKLNSQLLLCAEYPINQESFIWYQAKQCTVFQGNPSKLQ